MIENFSVYYRRIHLSDIAFENAYQEILEENEDCLEHACVTQGEFLKKGESLTYMIHYLQTIPCLKIKGSNKTGGDFFKAVDIK